MSAASFLRAIRAIESLYQSVVDAPQAWGDQAFADWANDALIEAAEMPKEGLREIRRALRAARKLQVFWSTQQSTVDDHGEWRSRVDIALGPRAWRPTLDLARVGLRLFPDEELFEQVKQRFALVNSDRWMDGVTFDEWAASQ